MSKSLEVVNENYLTEKLEREGEVFRYLKQSKYQDVPDEQINLLISYCRAAKLDPLSDVAYIIGYGKPTKVYKILPGIAKFRIQATRTGSYMGIDPPKYGKTLEVDISGKMTQYPEDCEVVVKRLISGKFSDHIATASGYAKWSDFEKFMRHNAIWYESPFNQIAKCAEANGLRKLFPELFGGEVTFDEMQGKIYDQEPEKDDRPYLTNVVDRIKNRVKSNEEQNFIEAFSAEEVTEVEQPEATSEEIDEKLLAFFDSIKEVNSAVKKNVDDYIENNKITKMTNARRRHLIKNIVLKFPEVKRQLSPTQKEYVDQLFKVKE